MHTDVKVVKEARQQLVKANSWVAPALASEGMDEELLERWREVSHDVVKELESWLEEAR